ncbi:hypothetical protein [Aurantibacillus circumpalustris]|uniref:hypothetical protein n=1 Tax=Aurantibacillus circumpalustris TaxID=3036359 RepID=UPI00295B7A81|nr:hypothetical protein [Aurantibacillus circumpalustris]
MRFLFIVLVSCLHFVGYSQITDSINLAPSSLFNNLKLGDSLTFYQCHVEEAVQQLSTASGQTLTGKTQKYTITEKYVLVKTDMGYNANYYTSSLNVFPNKKFSGLKIRERPYWAFEKEKTVTLNDQDLKVFLALEKKGHEAIEYDFGITRYNTNQIIIKQHKNFKQLVIEGNYVISKLIKL